MAKYEITYNTNGGNGKTIIDADKLNEVIATLENSGCFNIAVKQVYEADPCDNCKRNLCYGCPHAE